MMLTPPRRSYGFSPSLITVIVVLTILFVVANSIFVFNTNFGASFYANWLAGRLLFAQGENPYSAEVFEQILAKFPDSSLASGFTLPLYAVIPTLLFSFINDFRFALILWMTLCEAMLIIAAIRTVGALRLRSGALSPFTVGALSLLSFYGFHAVIDGDLGILSVLCLMLAVNAVRENEVELAGILLAFATIKYNITLLPILWILIWTLWNRRGGIAVWFLMVWTLLLLISFLFMPDWVIEFLRSVIYYYKYLSPVYFALFIETWQPEIGGRIAWAFSGFFALVLLTEWILNAKRDERAFEWVFALTITAGFLIGLANVGKNLHFLWIPVFYAVDKALLRWSSIGRWISIGIVAAFFFVPWIWAGVNGILFEPISGWNFFFPFIVLLLLYWNRWWIIERIVRPY